MDMEFLWECHLYYRAITDKLIKEIEEDRDNNESIV